MTINAMLSWGDSETWKRCYVKTRESERVWILDNNNVSLLVIDYKNVLY